MIIDYEKYEKYVMYDQILTDLLDDTFELECLEAAVIMPKNKLCGSRKAVRAVLKSRKEKEQSK